MKILKKNQIVIYVIAIMLMTAGYLNYSANDTTNSVETSMNIESKDDSKLADIGDATLVNSNDVVENDTQVEKTTDEYFSKSKLERETMYSQMLETY